ncbi:malto-oligosyltrehalose trehalohydrolase [Tessaracoccus antarcticus]|uniref:Malto-oligosyltrehalose trehalohydrolase n=2 Tax=Tessaracoccus antarcticus TaxID=2479848 RepID=A0A3M0GBX6_9ACTN|nr:malto-oligosyltrehalose trehalohydrolase [Tessaracoccus antarcticus]
MHHSNPLQRNVWAPTARRVEVVVDQQRLPMVLAEGRPGWWVLPETLQPGTQYAFSLDGGEPLPDPRSLFQPDGPHGPSMVVDPSLFRRPQSWVGRNLRGAVLYEMHVATFTAEGTFDAAIEHLDDLVDLGVDAVEVMPVADFAGSRGWGYDGVGLFAVHRAYGGPGGFVRFIDACHTRGLGVILDVVHNHLGPEGNYLAQFGPYFTDTHETPWGPAVNLDAPGAEEVRAFLVDSARQWLVDFGLDGLRLDAVHALADDSDKHFLVELSEAVAGWEEVTGRPLMLIAESDLNQPSMVSPVGSVPDARGMDAQWADDIHHALHSFFTNETQGYYVDFGPVEVLQKALDGVFVHDGATSTFRGEQWGQQVEQTSEDYDAHSFVAFLQDHDQVGNRATGDRIDETITPAQHAAAAALYLLSPYTPMLFMGEEWAASTPFPFFSDLGPDLGPLVTQGRAREFARMGWDRPVPDPQAETTMAEAVLRWDERSEPAHARMLDWYRTLIRIRHEQPDVLNPRLSQTTLEKNDDDTIVMRRGRVVVAATRATDRTVELDLGSVEKVLASWTPLEDGAGANSLPGGAIIALLPATL